MSENNFVKGAFIQLLATGEQKRVVNFQFNPEQILRTQQLDSGKNIVNESIRFTLVLNVADDLGLDQAVASEHGVYPQLAAVEELIEVQAGSSPSSNSIFGWLFGGQGQSSLIVFMWGQRVMPVKIQRLGIKEQIFNTQLKPVHVVVDIKMHVLTKNELNNHSPGQKLLVAYKNQRQFMAGLL